MESIFEKIDEENIKNQNLWRAGLLFITCALSIAILTSVVTDFVVPFEYPIGEIARHSVLAPRDFIFEDVIGTEQRKAEAESSIPRVFVLDDRPQSRPSARLNRMLEEIRVSTLPGNAEQDAKLRARIAEHYNLPLSDTGWELLRDPTSWPLLRETVERVVDPVLEKGVFSGKRALATTLSKYGVTMTRRSTGVSKPLVSPESVYDLNDATEILEASLPAMDMGVPTGLDKLVADVCRALLKPNLTFDSQETGRRIRDARSDTEPMFFQVRKGEVIVGEGERISRAHARKLDQLEKLRAGLGGLHSFAGYLILALLLTSTVYIFFFKFVDEFKPNFRDLTMIAVTLVASFIALRLMTTVGTAVSASFPAVGANAVTLATPFAIGGIVLQLTLGPGAVLFFTMICALLTGVFLQDSWLYLLLIVVGNTVGALSVERCRRRSIFLVAAFRVGMANLIICLAYLVLFTPMSPSIVVWQTLCAFFGGLLSGILAAAIIPIAEHFCGCVTDIKLLELASLDRPLLRELAVQAPGTWNHSMVMGHLAEAAAEAVGANPLLARVGAYYHDIGKCRKPGYFIENQPKNENRHDKLAPSMSALIIRSHVKDGVEMAEEQNLPTAIIDFITQHHGTGLIDYFYEKALREAEESEEVDDALYRYPGPKPQTKEAGILMLADQVEATSRVLSDPTPARIQGMVQKIVNKVFAAGQLDECEMTLRELHQIARAFTKVLSAIFHKRIEYSEPAEKGRESREKEEDGKRGEEKATDKESRDRHNRQTSSGGEASFGFSEEGDEPESAEALRRLGIEPH